MGRRLQVDRVVLRVAVAYTTIVFAVLLAFGAAAFAFLARVDADALRPVLDLPEGVAAYHTALLQAALAIGLVELALLFVVAPASYALALVSTRPLREARERERRFATDAAHELRTPLARIASVAQAALSGDDAARRAALGTITKTALEASSLIGDLLTLARAEHVPSAVREPVDLGAVARDVAATFEGARSDVAIDVRDEDGVFVDGDVTRLRRLIANLVDNAVRHARSHVQVEVRAAAGRAVIAVDDDGAGVAVELRERIFERFVTTTNGTGLGLSICRWIARAHGGDVRLVERSCFVAEFPLTGS